MARKKFLCVCRGGVVRSVAMAKQLKYEYGQDAVAISYDKNDSVMKMLSEWADHIVLMRAHFFDKFADYKDKVIICDVGPDIYGTASNYKLIRLIDAHCKDMINKKIIS